MPTPTPAVLPALPDPHAADLRTAGPAAHEIEVSVVLPCLNEADALPYCIRAAFAGLGAGGFKGEVIVADNGSSDGSVRVAEQYGARVIHVPERGYGAALMAGIAAARGRVVVMGDADASYNFEEIPRLVRPLADHDLCMGCRLPAGGGVVEPGAMPWLHRWIGNPFFTALTRRWFGAPIHDVYCGLRAFRVRAIQSLGIQARDMTFAIEMAARAGVGGLRIAEVPITLSPDKRLTHRGHLKTVRDGWRSLVRLWALRGRAAELRSRAAQRRALLEQEDAL